MSKRCINPPELFNSTDFGFSQIVVAQPGQMVFISGQVSWNEQREIVGKGDLKVQTHEALTNLQKAIESAGGTMQDIVMLRIYVVDYQATDGAIIGEALRQFFGTSSPPASTWINVKGLANEDFLIEIEAQAILT